MQELHYITGDGAAAMQLNLKAQLLDASIKSMRLTPPSSASPLIDAGASKMNNLSTSQKKGPQGPLN
ncbi:MAG: Uncharacterised protein [Prochlorococcus marinus str. MIT 9215]|nr:MAG: Uncharacterised protein [Prochlorococcus marinus str. MIT 9215]